MHSLLFIFSTLSTLSQALSLPPMLQISGNSTPRPPPAYVTGQRNATVSASEWPPLPFRYNFQQNAYINFLAYSLHDPPNIPNRIARACLYRILDAVRDLQPQTRPLPSGIVFTKDFDEVDASVVFTMGDGGRTLRGSQAVDVVGALLDLTRCYGTQGFERADVEVDGENLVLQKR